MPCNNGARPIQRWKSAYTGTFIYAAIANLAPAITVSVFSLGHTNMRAVISFSTPLAAPLTTAATLLTSCADSQLMITPSASRAPNLSMPSRSAATKMVGFCSGLMLRRKPLTENVSYSFVIFSPLNASCIKRTTSRTFLYGSTNGTPFHFSTITLLDEPIPIANRPGAASASAATLCAMTGAVRV